MFAVTSASGILTISRKSGTYDRLLSTGNQVLVIGVTSTFGVSMSISSEKDRDPFGNTLYVCYAPDVQVFEDRPGLVRVK